MTTLVIILSVVSIACLSTGATLVVLSQRRTLKRLAARVEELADPEKNPVTVFKSATGHQLFARARRSFEKGDHESAKQLWDWALKQFEQTGDLKEQLSCQQNIAMCLHKAGQQKQAIAIWQAVEIAARKYFPNSHLLHDVRGNLQNARETANDTEAQRLFEAARKLLIDKKYEQSRLMFDKAIALRPGNRDFETRALINKALCWERSEHYFEAQSLIGQAYKLARAGSLSTDEKTHDLLTEHMTRIKDNAVCADALKLSKQCQEHLDGRNFAAAEECGLQALEAAENAVGREHRVTAVILNKLALSKFERGLCLDARDLWQEAQESLSAAATSDEQLAEAIDKNLERCRDRLGF